MSDNIWCYAARFAGMPGYGVIVGDVPEYAVDTAETVADWIKRGATVERVTLDNAVRGLKEYRDAQKGEQR